MNGHFFRFQGQNDDRLFNWDINAILNHFSHLDVYAKVADFPGISIGGENPSVSTVTAEGDLGALLPLIWTTCCLSSPIPGPGNRWLRAIIAIVISKPSYSSVYIVSGK